MATLSFRLPSTRPAVAARGRGAAARAARGAASSGPMNAEAAARIALRRLGEAANADAGEVVTCGGWFDSTWELSQGLDICEVTPSQLPLDSWLQIYLAQRPAVAAVSPAAAAAAA